MEASICTIYYICLLNIFILVVCRNCTRKKFDVNTHIDCSRTQRPYFWDELKEQNSKDVTSLDISWNNIHVLNYTELDRFTHLDELILAGNERLGLVNAIQMLSNVRNARPRKLCLDKIERDVIRLNDTLLCNEFLRGVTHLTLRANNIVRFHVGVFHCVPNLQFFSLGFNYILAIEPNIPLLNLTSFQYIPFPYEFLQRLKYVDISWFHQTPKLYIEHFFDTTELFLGRDIDEYEYDLNVSDITANNTYYNTWNGQYIYATHMTLGNVWSSTPFQNIPTVIFFDLSHNSGEKEQIYKLSSLPNLQIYNCSYCGFGKVSDDAFVGMPNLRELNLSRNSMGNFKNSYPDIFKPLQKLEVLSLADNHISTLAKESFIKLTFLRHLDLSGNYLQYIDLVWTSSLLSSLDFYYNTLKDDFINKEARGEISALPSTITLKIGPNLICSCGSAEFFRWLENNPRVVIPRFMTSNCSFNDQSFLLPDALISLTSTMECTGVAVPVAVSTVIFGCFILVLSIVIHRYKIYIRWFMYRIKHRICGDTKYRKNDDILYDVYLSVSYDDLAWIKESILSYLEDEKGFRVYLFERDSIPGAPIADNIFYGISNSNSIIVILSPSFIKDEWRDWELSMAVASGRSRIAIVKIGDITARDLKLGGLLKSLILPHPSVTYNEWQPGTCGDNVLLNALEMHIKHNSQKQNNELYEFAETIID